MVQTIAREAKYKDIALSDICLGRNGTAMLITDL